MILGRDLRRLLPALLLSLLLHLWLAYGLNVYGNGPTASKAPTRLTVRLARPPKPLPGQPQPPAAALPSARIAVVTESPLRLPASAPSPTAPVSIIGTPSEQPPVDPEPPVALPPELVPQIPTLNLLESPDLRFLPPGEVDVPARPATPIAPNFPIQFQRSDFKGMVVILLRIDETGIVVSAEVEFADPPGLFDQAALGPFVHARYLPAEKNGLPVRSEKRIEVVFGDYQRPLFGPPLPSPNP